MQVATSLYLHGKRILAFRANTLSLASSMYDLDPEASSPHFHRSIRDHTATISGLPAGIEDLVMLE